MASIVRFDEDQNFLGLDGYGFDLLADRVVRFNKHPEGVYMNTRSSYTINTRKYTHFELREFALSLLKSEEERVKFKPQKKKKKVFLWIVVSVLIMTLLSNCSFNFDIEINSHSSEQIVEN